ncbi:putative MFS-type transporter [Pseudocercospora fuligena]|uniref:Putative MFS-type transporter n=1 Tax=Pseudocercospora fuligena TaxID=685502 RepID=A0A8H6RGB3_9PEZI|nr:putative MFS-type transporter [Pseudocercospora fuligena]
MAFGILNDNSLARVPGTVHLEEQEQYQTNQAHRQGLKHGTSRGREIVLVPQPSDDPNDPLNWPITKKITIVVIVVFGAFIMPSCFGPLLSAGTAVVAIDLNISIADVTILSGYQLLVAGCWGPFVNALSRRYGKRPQFLFGSIMALIGTIICSVSHDYTTLLAGRVIQGFSYSAYESLIFAVVGDLFFVHQRGMFVSIMSFGLAAISNLTSVICGPITTNLGWHYLFHILDALLGFQLILVFFFVPETAYERSAKLEIDEIAEDISSSTTSSEKPKTDEFEHTRSRTSSLPPPPKKTYVQSLAIFTGVHSDENVVHLLIAPFLCIVNLGAMWMVIGAGALNAFFVSQSYVAAQIFFYPPYNLSAAGVGYLFVGPFLGATLGSIVLALAMDPLILWCTNKNKGFYEPEFRLLPVTLGLLSGVGLMSYAYAVDAQISMYTCSFLWGLSMFGIIFMITPSNSYVIDAFRDLSSEMFIASMMFKNFIFYGFSYFVNDWAAAKGPGQVFYVFGGVASAIVLSTLPLYVYGKRYRSYWHRHNLLRKLGIKTHAEL